MNDDQRALLNLLADFGKIAQEAISDKAEVASCHAHVKDLEREINDLNDTLGRVGDSLSVATQLLRDFDIRYGLVSLAGKLAITLDPDQMKFLLDSGAVKEVLVKQTAASEIVEEAGLGIFKDQSIEGCDHGLTGGGNGPAR